MTVTSFVKAAATLDTDELSRLARRREIKRQVARRNVIASDIGRLRSEVAAIENRVDGLTASHQSEVADLRTQMDAMLEQMADAPSDKLSAKRAALQQQIVDKTKALETAVGNARIEAAGVRKLIKPLEHQLEGLPIENALTHIDIANPELLTRKFVRDQKIKFLESRLATAKQWLDANQVELDRARLPGSSVSRGPYFDPSPGKPDANAIKLYERRCRHWQAEFEACQSEIAEALAEGRIEHRRMIEE